MKRVLHILPQFQPGGGMEHVVMNYFEHIDRKEYQFDILTHKMEDDTYAKEIWNTGGHVYLYPKFSIRTVNEIKSKYQKLLMANKYDIVHCHMANAAFLYLYIAAQACVPLRILHSHQDHYGDKITHAIRNIPLIEIGKNSANLYIACSEKSGKFLFGKKKFCVLKNGIDAKKYKYSNSKRATFRGKINVDLDTRVFGIIGRLVPQKNIKFAIDVFNSYSKKYDARAVLVIAGDGEKRIELQEYVHLKGLDAKIVWLGNIKEIDVLNSGIDVLIMPSFYEGLPLSLIEAQCAGVQCYVSTNIIKESCVDSYSHRLSLKRNSEYWAKQIHDTYTNVDRVLGYEEIRKTGYDICDVSHELITIYNQIS